MNGIIHKYQMQRLSEIVSRKTLTALQPHQLPAVNEALQELVKSHICDSVDDAINKLDRLSLNSSVWGAFVSAITIAESYFFRDSEQMQFLISDFFPELIHQKTLMGNHELRIWSAGCAAGQELYSILILLQSLLPDYEHWQIKAIGTDINPQVLALARQGIFGKWSLRAANPQQIEKNFKKLASDEFHINDALRPGVRFVELNLADADYSSALDGYGPFDLILCRNVFIYFSRSSAPPLASHIGRWLAPEGILLLGAADPLDELPRDLQRCEAGDVCYWQHAHAPERTLPQDTALAAAVEQQEMAPTPEPPVDISLKRSQQQLKALADQGRLQEALSLGEQLIQEHPNDDYALYLLGLVNLALGNEQLADERFAQVIAIKPTCFDACYYLANLALKRRDETTALSLLKQVQSMINNVEPNYSVYEAGGISAGDMRTLVDVELDRLRTSAEKRSQGGR